MMDDKTRARYAAIGRGERLQWKNSSVISWCDWMNFAGDPPLDDDDRTEWRIAPPAPIPVELPHDVVTSFYQEEHGTLRVLITFNDATEATAFVDTVRKEQQK